MAEVRVEFRRSGGIVGIDMAASAEAHELPDDEARILSDLLDPAGIPAATSPAPPDAFQYAVTVTDGERTETHHWAETDVPAAVRPLLSSLTSRARPAPPG